MTFYVLNFCCVGFLNYFMWRYISNPVHRLAEPPIEAATLKMAKMRSLLVPCFFLLMLPVAYFTNVIFAIYIPVFIPLTLRFLRRRMTRKEAQLHSERNIMVSGWHKIGKVLAHLGLNLSSVVRNIDAQYWLILEGRDAVNLCLNDGSSSAFRYSLRLSTSSTNTLG